MDQANSDQFVQGEALWVSGHTSMGLPTRQDDQVPLSSVSSNEKLKRVILHYKVVLFNASSEVLDTWRNRGLLSFVELTRGDPPPEPAPPSQGGFDQRDLLHTQLNSVYLGAPGFGNIDPLEGVETVKVDITPLRSGTPEPAIVWWNWGIAGPPIAGVEVAVAQAWWRVLLNTVP